MRYAALLVLAAVWGCDEPLRPAGAGDEAEIQLSVEVLSPRTDETVLAGRLLSITVHGAEPGGKLDGIGYVLRRPGGDAVTLDSILVAFDVSEENTQTLTTFLPDTFATNYQLDIYGLASGGGEIARSQPRHVIALHCPPQASWC